MITLRPYQQESVDSLFAYFGRSTNNPIVVLPTGAGKSLALASFVRTAIERFPVTQVLIATHRKELIEQDANAMQLVGVNPGIYSAGLGSHQIRQVTIGGVQSLAHIRDLPAFDLLIVDECHLIPTYDDGQYRELIGRMREKNEALKIIGYTATPFRLQGGSLLRGKDKIFHSIAYEKPVQELVDEGYLSPLVSAPVQSQIQTAGLRITRGDYSKGDIENAADTDDLIMRTLDEVDILAKDRKALLFFCVSIKHAEHVVIHLRMRGHVAEIVHGGTDAWNRNKILQRFKAGGIRCLVSVDVLTTGFDAPITDCICLLRPTASCGLYVQMVGRGMRLYPGKADCLVLDFGGNIDRHGPITDIRIKSVGPPTKKEDKECPNCGAEVAAHKKECPECGKPFPVVERKIAHDRKASTQAIMAPKEPPKLTAVVDVNYSVHIKKDGDGPPTMRVDYEGAFRRVASEWVCVEHVGYARGKAEQWWHLHGGMPPCPKTVEEAIDRAREELRHVTAVLVEQDGKYTRVKSCEYGWKASEAPKAPDWTDDGEELPF